MESGPSTTSPPKDAPIWAVKADYHGNCQSDNACEENQTPLSCTPAAQADPSAVTPSSSRLSDVLGPPRRILSNEGLFHAFAESNSSSSDDSD